MGYIVFLVVLALSYFIGVFGWAQIVGSFQNLKTRGPKVLVTIVIWALIIAASYGLMKRFAPGCFWAWVIAMVISLIQILKAGKIE